MRIFITGGCGYIGSQLIRDIAQYPNLTDAEVVIYDNLSSENYQALMDLEARGYRFIQGDILDREKLAESIKDVDAVVHLAGVVNAPLSFAQPVLTREVNYYGTKNVLEISDKAGVTAFVYASTASVYGPTDFPATEDHPAKGRSPYADTKLMAEKAILEHAKASNMRGIIFRLATVFGYSRTIRFHTALNRLVFLASAGQPLTIYGNGTQTRPFIHVEDVSQATCYALSNSDISGIYNVSTDNVRIIDIVKAIQEMGRKVTINWTDKEILNQISYAVDNGKFARAGFQCKHSIADGIREFTKMFSGLESHIPDGGV